MDMRDMKWFASAEGARYIWIKEQLGNWEDLQEECQEILKANGISFVPDSWNSGGIYPTDEYILRELSVDDPRYRRGIEYEYDTRGKWLVKLQKTIDDGTKSPESWQRLFSQGVKLFNLA